MMASISGSQEYLALLSALLQLSLRPGPTLAAMRSLRAEQSTSKRGSRTGASAAPVLATSLSGSDDDDGEQDRLLAKWGFDLTQLTEAVADLLRRCQPSTWLHSPVVADETFSGLLSLAAVLVHRSTARKQALCGADRAMIGRLYTAFLFPRMGVAEAEAEGAATDGDHDNEAAQTLGAMYIDTKTRSLTYSLLVELSKGVPENWLELVRCIGRSPQLTLEGGTDSEAQPSSQDTARTQVRLERRRAT
jgi:hypothetical protein